MMRSPLFLALALAVGAGTPLLAGQASAQTTRAVRATAEMSMVLSGHIEITPEGEVSSLVLDQKSTWKEQSAAGASNPRCTMARQWLHVPRCGCG